MKSVPPALAGGSATKLEKTLDLSEPNRSNLAGYDHPPATAGGTDFSLSATIRLPNWKAIEERQC